MSGPLDGLRVVEFAQNLAVPYCGRLLAGLGADVVKVEPPTGDAMRHVTRMPQRESKAFALINPGKRAVAVDLGRPEARTVVDGLFAWADVALVAFKPDDLVRYGIDWDTARAVNPRLVHLTTTALGPDGPDADDPGYDGLVQGRSGLGWIMNRSNGSAPQSTRPAINDIGTGMVSLAAVLVALRHRDQTGQGQRVDTSLLGTAMALATPMVARFPGDAEVLADLDEELTALRLAGAGFDQQRAHYESRVQPAGGDFLLYFRHYRTADGLISVAGVSPGLVEKFHRITGLPVPEVRDTDDPGFLRVVAEAEELFASRTTAAWIAALRAGGYPCGPYHLPHEAIDDPQVRANDYTVELDHPTIGSYTTTGMPMRFERGTATVSGPSPRFGEHTRSVLAEIGVVEADVERLIETGVVVEGDGRQEIANNPRRES